MSANCAAFPETFKIVILTLSASSQAATFAIDSICLKNSFSPLSPEKVGIRAILWILTSWLTITVELLVSGDAGSLYYRYLEIPLFWGWFHSVIFPIQIYPLLPKIGIICFIVLNLVCFNLASLFFKSYCFQPSLIWSLWSSLMPFCHERTNTRRDSKWEKKYLVRQLELSATSATNFVLMYILLMLATRE